GAGSGFLAVAAFIPFFTHPLETPIGTSLLIIAINSIFGFVFSIGRYHFNWNILLIFTALAIGGVIIGSMLSQKINANSLKRIFGWFVLLMALYIIINELFLH